MGLQDHLLTMSMGLDWTPAEADTAHGTGEAKIYYGVDQFINGDLTAGNALLIHNNVDNNAVAKAEAYAFGIFGTSTSVDATAWVKGAAVLGGVASLTVTGLWARLFPSLRKVDRLE